jgi:phage terminase large subunit
MASKGKPSLNPSLRDFWLTPARNRVLYGGRASSKSWDAAGFVIFLANKYRLRVLCVRQFQNKISESVYALLKIQIERFGLRSRFDIQKNNIYSATGSEFMFYGLWRSIDEIKSLESIDILWIEEGHNLTEEQWEVLEPTIRKEHSQVWLVFNPRLSTDFAYKRFVRNPPPKTITRLINYDENPFLSKTMIDIIDAAKQEDFDEFQHIYLGVPKEDDDKAVIKRTWLMAAIDAHKKVTPAGGSWKGGVTVGYDVADDGDDKNATTSMDGSIAIHLDEWNGGENELNESASRVRLTAERLAANSIGYDSIGVGAGTGSTLNTQGWTRHFKFNAGGAVHKPDSIYGETRIKNKDFFSNLKAQAWWLTADRLRNTYLAVHKGKSFAAEDMISISSECDSKLLDKLIDELATPKRDFDNAGKVKVESKKDLDKRDVKSPNIADSFIIANSAGLCSSGKSWYDY